MENKIMLNNLENLLQDYGYEYTCRALEKIIDEWYYQKQYLRSVLCRHPNWREDLDMIVFDTSFEREINVEKIHAFSLWCRDTYSKMNNGVWIGDLFNLYNFPRARFVDEKHYNVLKVFYPDLKIHKGAKMSRVINKICIFHGLDKHPDYNKEFAKFADALNPMQITRHTCISINLLDYLTMSFGNSWSSCHTIDKNNTRGMPNNFSGCYSSGTLSYALDSTSFVYYTVDSSYNGNEYYFEPKITRQMYHFNGTTLVQGRLYPQSMDTRAGDLYDVNRNLIQEILALGIEKPNLWILNRDLSTRQKYIISKGTNYDDYFQGSFPCTISFLKDFDKDDIWIGAEPICIECGYRHREETNINCCMVGKRYCAECGVLEYEEEMYEINGEWYCTNCVEQCHDCGGYYARSEMHETGRGYVCEDCFEDYEYCVECEEYEPECDGYWVDDEFVCRTCFEDNYYICDDCGDYVRYDKVKEHDNGYYCQECYEAILEEEREEQFDDDEINDDEI